MTHGKTQQARRNPAARLSWVPATQSTESSVRNSRAYRTGTLFLDDLMVTGILGGVKHHQILRNASLNSFSIPTSEKVGVLVGAGSRRRSAS
jgi:hypothetical protein